MSRARPARSSPRLSVGTGGAWRATKSPAAAPAWTTATAATRPPATRSAGTGLARVDPPWRPPASPAPVTRRSAGNACSARAGQGSGGSGDGRTGGVGESVAVAFRRAGARATAAMGREKTEGPRLPRRGGRTSFCESFEDSQFRKNSSSLSLDEGNLFTFGISTFPGSRRRWRAREDLVRMRATTFKTRRDATRRKRPRQPRRRATHPMFPSAAPSARRSRSL